MSEEGSWYSELLSYSEKRFDHVDEQLDDLGNVLVEIAGRVQTVSEDQRATQERVESVYAELCEFIAADRQAKELQRALTEIVRVRQEIDKRFGRFDQARSAAVGLLQASSLELVRKNTLHNMAEELMAQTARYWLPPALLALSAWVMDDRPLAERAVAEALLRDGRKTSLFFALVCRRAERPASTVRWLSRYFRNQDPLRIDREVVVMLDALAYGVFGGDALSACSKVIESWIGQLEAAPGFREEQRRRWIEKLEVMTPAARPEEFPALGYSPTAPRLFASLAEARRNQVAHDFFSDLFTGELAVPPQIEVAVDALLDSLVTNFDDVELPLRREERLLQLVKEERGDRVAAEHRFAAESEAMRETLSFAALLANAAMSPAQMNATRATQRYAVSRSRQWILAAHGELVAAARAGVPRLMELAIGSWTGSSADGSEEPALQADLARHYEERTAAAVAAVRPNQAAVVALVLAGVLALPLMTLGTGGVVAGLGLVAAVGGFFAWKRREVERERRRVRQELEAEHEQAARFLSACLGELLAYRDTLAVEDAKAQKVADLLAALASPRFVVQRPEQRASVA